MGGKIEVQVLGVLVADDEEGPVVILRAVEGEETLVIRIGIPEAHAIDAVLEDVEPPRPLTHDLFLETLKAFQLEVVEGEITDLREDTYFARLRVRRGATVVELDARPSDTMALCLRARAPLFVQAEVFRKAEPQDPAESSRRQWIGFLKSLEASEDPDSVLDRGEEEAEAGETVEPDDTKGTVN